MHSEGFMSFRLVFCHVYIYIQHFTFVFVYFTPSSWLLQAINSDYGCILVLYVKVKIVCELNYFFGFCTPSFILFDAIFIVKFAEFSDRMKRTGSILYNYRPSGSCTI